MFWTADLVGSLAGLIIPPAYDFIKKKFVKESNDTPERTMGALAATSPEVLPEYIKALATNRESLVKWFNRDVIGVPAQWVVTLRAAIRPVTVALCLVGLGFTWGGYITPEAQLTAFAHMVVMSWMSSRLIQR